MRAVLIRISLALLLCLPASAAAQRVTRNFILGDSIGPVAGAPQWMRLTPPAKYDQWWREIARCQQLPLPSWYITVDWYVLNTRGFYDVVAPSFRRLPNGDVMLDEKGRVIPVWALAISYARAREVYIAISYIDEESIVKHEMAHFLIAWAGEFNPADPHPIERFTKCGLTVQWSGKAP